LPASARPLDHPSPRRIPPLTATSSPQAVLDVTDPATGGAGTLGGVVNGLAAAEV
jgi:hypothetical protein